MMSHRKLEDCGPTRVVFFGIGLVVLQMTVIRLTTAYSITAAALPHKSITARRARYLSHSQHYCRRLNALSLWEVKILKINV
jgi:hypothetical protein